MISHESNLLTADRESAVDRSGWIDQQAAKRVKKWIRREFAAAIRFVKIGAILITKAFLPYMRGQKGSTIVHIGGFADGRLAFPYYSVDAASRAGLFTFIEAVKRELELEGSKTRVAFFCPSFANTDAERPFHPLWRKMGVSILPVEKVAEDLLRTIEKNKTVRIMGGASTILFTKLNSISPKLADVIMMKKYGKMLQQFLYGTKENGLKKPENHKSGNLHKIAIILIFASFLLQLRLQRLHFCMSSLGSWLRKHWQFKKQKPLRCYVQGL